MKKFSLKESVGILLLLLIILAGGVNQGLSPETPVLTVIAILILIAKLHGADWEKIHKGIKEGISTALIPIFIFILIGILIAVWIKAGIIPALMVVGFKLISVKFFVPSVFLVCALVGASIGSGFTTISTIGIALFGMGITMNMNPALVTGAILSGAIFGDKTSPLSDSTNLASAISGTDLFAHIKNLMWTTIPALLISLVVFVFIGRGKTEPDFAKIDATMKILNQNFSISWVAAIPVILMFLCAWFKIPAIPTLFINIAVSTGIILVNDPHISLKGLAALMETGYVAHTKNEAVNALLTRGGISNMMGTVSLIITTLALGGLLMELGIIQTAMEPLIQRLNRPGKLVLSTILAGIGINLFVGEQYLSVILPGRAFKDAFDRVGLAPLALGRVLEDGGSVINYLIPWGVAGSFAASTLGVPVLEFLPFTLFALLSPILSVISGYTGIGLKMKKEN
ncbi:Na+/H+ antiporter NhaC family protein [Ligilactobacillus salivarius]